MSRQVARIALILLFAGAAPAFAQEPEPDAEGCKDSKLLSRMPGCRIQSCEVKEFDSRELAMKYEAESNKTIEGAVEEIEYLCPAKYSLLQILRNAEGALKKAGYTILYSGKSYSENDYPVVTAQKGAQWISVQTSPYNDDTLYKQTAVLEQTVAQTMTAGAQEMADAISKSGRLDVYGITFATGQATITAQSDQVLSDVLSVLQANADWKLRIEGHTDNVGDKAANQKLSDARARAVAAWLAGKGIDASRLSAVGLGDTQPVADNKTEDGRAKNRRVVLVKQ